MYIYCKDKCSSAGCYPEELFCINVTTIHAHAMKSVLSYELSRMSFYQQFIRSNK
jgi:hypothetical protein